MKYIKTSLFLLGIFLSSVCVHGQAYTLTSNSSTKVSGTSTTHDWELLATDMNGSAEFKLEDGKVVDITSLRVIFKATELEGDKSKMTELAQDAIKADKFGSIGFLVTEVISIENGIARVKGNLSIAGKMRSITVEGRVSVTGDTVKVMGTAHLSMPDYEVTPPSLFMGAIVVDPNCVINFNLEFKL